MVVYNTRKGEDDCTCESVNRGLWFEEGSVKVPHRYLVTEGILLPHPGSIPWVAIVVFSLFMEVGGGLALLLRILSNACPPPAKSLE